MQSIPSLPVRILVTGGAGYIGSVVSRQLRDHGDEVAVVDSIEIPVRQEPRRAGDPPNLVAATVKAHDELGWRLEKRRSRAWSPTPGIGFGRIPRATGEHSTPLVV
jgi:UDP-glucose 4-epimerase